MRGMSVGANEAGPPTEFARTALLTTVRGPIHCVRDRSAGTTGALNRANNLKAITAETSVVRGLFGDFLVRGGNGRVRLASGTGRLLRLMPRRLHGPRLATS